jgi:hypothetical protein
MDDLMSKIQEVLSDEESLKQVQELASMFMSAKDEESNTNETKNDSNDSDGLGIDLGMIMKFGEAMNSASHNDKHTDFLLALKPFLKEERQAKVDKAVKLLKLYTVFTIVKESGMLDEFKL